MDKFGVLFIVFSLFVCCAQGLLGQENLKLLGRWNKYGQSNWPMSGFETNVIGELGGILAVEFNQCDKCRYIVEAFVDGISQGRFTVDPTNITFNIPIPANAKTSAQTIKLLKVSEADYPSSNGGSIGTMSINKITPSSGLRLTSTETSSSAKKLKFLVFGDSLTCGYGTLGKNPCNYTPETESASDSWASVTAKSFGAELSQVTWSGKGVVRNYGDAKQTSSFTLPFYYNRTLGFNPTDPGFSYQEDAYWQPSAYIPDVVMVLLGSNDYNTQPFPDASVFIAGYTQFVQQIQADYPTAKVVLLCSMELANTPKCDNVQTTAQLNGVYFQLLDVPTQWDGCNGHPDVNQQALMAQNNVIPLLKTFI